MSTRTEEITEEAIDILKSIHAAEKTGIALSSDWALKKWGESPAWECLIKKLYLYEEKERKIILSFAGEELLEIKISKTGGMSGIKPCNLELIEVITTGRYN